MRAAAAFAVKSGSVGRLEPTGQRDQNSAKQHIPHIRSPTDPLSYLRRPGRRDKGYQVAQETKLACDFLTRLGFFAMASSRQGVLHPNGKIHLR